MSCPQRAGKHENLTTVNKSVETVVKFKYLGKTARYESSSQEKMRAD
jgi:hypothetical protein